MKKVVARVRQGPCNPKDLYTDKNLNLRHRTVEHDLKLGCEIGIFRRLDGRYAWIDYVAEDEVKEALEDLMFIFGYPNPPIEYVASHPKVGEKSEGLMSILHKLGWHEPSPEEKQDFERERKSLSKWAWELENRPNSTRLSNLDPKIGERIRRFHMVYPRDISPPTTTRISGPDEQPALF